MQSDIQSVIKNMPISVFVLDRDGVVVQWNHACELLTGILASQIVGTKNQWSPFYSTPRPVLADLVLAGCSDADLTEYYGGKFWPSEKVPGGYEGEGFFPKLGLDGLWLYFTAGIIRNEDGSLIGSIETIQDITDQRRREEALRQSEERFREISRTDPLTNLYNLRTFRESLDIEYSRAIRYGRRFSLVLIDIDDFKSINDEHGHLMGDAVLKNVARCIRNSLRTVDSAYRYGGDEFFILLPEVSAVEAKVIAERVRSAVGKYPISTTRGESVTCSLSIGIAEFSDGDTPDQLIDRADRGVYKAKVSEKNQVVVVPINAYDSAHHCVDHPIDKLLLGDRELAPQRQDMPCNRSCGNWQNCTPIRHFDSIESAIHGIEFDTSITTRFTLCRQSDTTTILCVENSR